MIIQLDSFLYINKVCWDTERSPELLNCLEIKGDEDIARDIVNFDENIERFIKLISDCSSNIFGRVINTVKKHK